LALLGIGAVVALIALVAVPAINQHALDRHGMHAVRAVDGLRRHTPEPEDDGYWTGTDADGREYHIVKLPQLPGGLPTWGVVILGGGGAFLVTAFLCQSEGSVERIKGKCR
jgi:hypothetical protein